MIILPLDPNIVECPDLFVLVHFFTIPLFPKKKKKYPVPTC